MGQDGCRRHTGRYLALWQVKPVAQGRLIKLPAIRMLDPAE